MESANGTSITHIPEDQPLRIQTKFFWVTFTISGIIFGLVMITEALNWPIVTSLLIIVDILFAIGCALSLLYLGFFGFFLKWIKEIIENKREMKAFRQQQREKINQQRNLKEEAI